MSILLQCNTFKKKWHLLNEINDNNHENNNRRQKNNKANVVLKNIMNSCTTRLS